MDIEIWQYAEMMMMIKGFTLPLQEARDVDEPALSSASLFSILTSWRLLRGDVEVGGQFFANWISIGGIW